MLKSDVVVTLDSSASIEPQDWLKLMSFTDKLMKDFPIGASGMNVAGVQFASKAEKFFDLTGSKSAALAGVKGIKRTELGAATNMHLAVDEVLKIETASRDVIDVMLVITDGQPTDKSAATKAFAKAKAAGIKVVFVLVGWMFKLLPLPDEWSAVKPILIDSYSGLEAVRKQVVQMVCKEVTTVTTAPPKGNPVAPPPGPKFCPCKGSGKTEEENKGLEVLSPPSVPDQGTYVLTGASGGYVAKGDTGGAACNGVYKPSGLRNHKTQYKNENGCVLSFEIPSDWGAKFMAGSKHAWTIACQGHHRYWLNSTTDSPPVKTQWNLRTNEGLEITSKSRPVLNSIKALPQMKPHYIGSLANSSLHPYVYASSLEATNACIAAGYKGLCSKKEVDGFERCAAGWMSDYKGYWMSKTAKGCGAGKGFRSWGSGKVGAYCCHIRASWLPKVTGEPTLAPTSTRSPTRVPTHLPTHPPTRMPSTKQVYAYSKKYAMKWPHCTNIRCMSGSKCQMEVECTKHRDCTGFSFSTGAVNGNGCIKKCGRAEFGGFGVRTHDYYAKGGLKTCSAGQELLEATEELAQFDKPEHANRRLLETIESEESFADDAQIDAQVATDVKWGGSRRRRWHKHHRHHRHHPHQHHRHHRHTVHAVADSCTCQGHAFVHAKPASTPVIRTKYTASVGGNGGGALSSYCPGNAYVSWWKIRTGSLVDRIQGKCSDGTWLRTCGGSGGGENQSAGRWGTQKMLVRTGRYADQFNARGGYGGHAHWLDCGPGYRITGYNLRCGSLVDKIQLQCKNV